VVYCSGGATARREDLVDGLVDALTDLTETGYIWLVTPGSAEAGSLMHVGAAGERSRSRTIMTLSAISLLPDWAVTSWCPEGTRVVEPGRGRQRLLLISPRRTSTVSQSRSRPAVDQWC